MVINKKMKLNILSNSELYCEQTTLKSNPKLIALTSYSPMTNGIGLSLTTKAMDACLT